MVNERLVFLHMHYSICLVYTWCVPINFMTCKAAITVPKHLKRGQPSRATFTSTIRLCKYSMKLFLSGWSQSHFNCTLHYSCYFSGGHSKLLQLRDASATMWLSVLRALGRQGKGKATHLLGFLSPLQAFPKEFLTVLLQDLILGQFLPVSGCDRKVLLNGWSYFGGCSRFSSWNWLKWHCCNKTQQYRNTEDWQSWP